MGRCQRNETIFHGFSSAALQASGRRPSNRVRSPLGLCRNLAHHLFTRRNSPPGADADGTMTSFEPVRAVLRGLEVLRVLNEGGPMTATAISNGTDLPQPTIIRILETLMAAGYVYKTEEANIYGVTARTLSLSSGFDANSRIVQLSQHLIEDLRTEIGWPTNLAVFVDADAAMSIVYTNRKAYGMSMPGRLGARLPLLVT